METILEIGRWYNDVLEWNLEWRRKWFIWELNRIIELRNVLENHSPKV